MIKALLKYPVLTVYIVALLLSLKFVLFDYILPQLVTLNFALLPDFADSTIEYQLYMQVIKYGNIVSLDQDLLGSSLTVTVLPAWIQKILHTDPYWTFRLYAAFIIPVLPVIIYYLARKWHSVGWSVACAVLASSWMVFLEGGYYKRTIIALIFAALMILALASDKWNWKIRYLVIALCAVCIPLSHYSVAFGALGILVVMLGMVVAWRDWQYIKPITFGIVISLLCVLVYYGVWHRPVMDVVGRVAGFSTGVTSFPTSGIPMVIPVVVPTVITTVKKYIAMYGYFVMILIAIGFLTHYRTERMGKNALMVAGIGAIVAAVAVPALQAFYGFNRIQFQAMLPATVYFPTGVFWLADNLGINPKLLAYIIITCFLVVSLVYSTMASNAGVV